MAYEGDELHQCLVKRFDFTNAYAVVVSGARFNPCGHMLVNTGGGGGYYFHIAVIRGYPRYMNESGFRRYLRENGKRELRRERVVLDNPEAASNRLDLLLSKSWTWFVLPHNCASFAEDVLQAGGAKGGLYSNCPSAEKFR